MDAVCPQERWSGKPVVRSLPVPQDCDGRGVGARLGVPGGRSGAGRIALRGLDPDDPRAEATKLATRVRPGQLAGEVDDEVTGKRLQGVATYH